jgi:hypothetical protein
VKVGGKQTAEGDGGGRQVGCWLQGGPLQRRWWEVTRVGEGHMQQAGFGCRY